MHEHVTDDAIDRYLSGAASDAERGSLRDAVAGCARCAQACAGILRVDDALRARRIDVPDGLVHRQLARVEYAQPGKRLGARAMMVRAAALLIAAAIGAAAASVGGRLLDPRGGDRQPSGYLFLLSGSHAAELSVVRRQAVGRAFGRWADSLARAGVLDQQAQLERTAFDPVLSDTGSMDSTTVAALARVEGFFLVRARNDADAVALARSSPYLEFGGTIVVRRRRLSGARALSAVIPSGAPRAHR